MLAIFIYTECVVTPKAIEYFTYLPMKTMGWTLISARILEEVQLMISLGVPPLTGRYNLGDNFLPCKKIDGE
jgi:hypothetical protein